jgi:hypothetical protein
LRRREGGAFQERQQLRRKLDEVDRAHQRESETARREFLIAMRRMSEQRDAAEGALKDDRMDTAACVTRNPLPPSANESSYGTSQRDDSALCPGLCLVAPRLENASVPF